MKVIITDCCKRKKRKVFIVPILGAFREAVAVVKSPQFHSNHKGRTIMAFQMTDSQQVDLSVKFVDKKGQPAKVDGAPTWLTDNTDVLTLTPSADGLSCTVVAVGAIGSATVTMSADADLGAGVVPLVGTFEIEITAGQATAVTITAGTPIEQP